jgi:hypothetical protein
VPKTHVEVSDSGLTRRARAPREGALRRLGAAERARGDKEDAFAEEGAAIFDVTNESFRGRIRPADAGEIAHVRRELLVSFASCSA